MKKTTILALTLALLLALVTGCTKEYQSYGPEQYDEQFSAPKKGDTMACFHTNMGDITVRLFKKEAPKAVENFTTHAKNGYYNNQLFYRVIEDYYIQSGDPTSTGRGGESIWGTTFEDECVPYLAPYYGSLCMANYGDNTNTCQFFFVVRQEKDVTMYKECNVDAADGLKVDAAKFKKYEEVGGAPHLDYQLSGVRVSAYPEMFKQYHHTVFGQIVEGMDIAMAISQVPVAGEKEINEAEVLMGEDQNLVVEYRPLQDVIIETVEIYTFSE